MSAGNLTRDELVREVESVRQQLEREREVTARILRLASSSSDLHDLLREATLLVREWSGCDTVGIRLRDGDDFPYYETRGCPPQFVLAENPLCMRDCDGQVACDLHDNAVQECMCGNILGGRFDASLPFFTPGGSFWTNSTTELLASTTEADRQARTRNRCHGEGYESVALIPLRSGGRTFGLLQLNDRRRGRFNAELIDLLESLGHALAEAIARRAAALEGGSLLRQNQAELRAIYDNSPIMMCVLDSQRCLLYVNRTMSEFIGKTEEELIRQRACGIIGCVNALEDPRGCGYGTDCQSCALRLALEDTLATGRSHRGIERCMTLARRDGVEEVTLVAATALIQTEAGKSLLVCLEDITRQRADENRLADMQLQLHHTSRLAAMGELAAGIAHEVNQPLCSIVNFANACRNIARGESADWGQIRTWSDAIASSAAQAGDIIRRLISFARRPQADREVVRVQQLFDDAILLVQHEARVNRVVVQLATADAGLTVFAQPVPIHQVMVNLLRNSIDSLGAAPSLYSHGLRRQVVVHAARVAEGVEITVVDNGPGVPESVLPKIFEPFYTTKSHGLGLGLVISKTIVEDHHGKIWATTNRDGGLAVHFTLPAGRDESQDDAQQNGIRH